MQSTDLPFNLTILKITPDRIRGVKPVTSADIMGTSGEKLGDINKLGAKDLSWAGANKLSSNLSEDGLFSVSIFGRVGSEERDTRFSYVNIRTEIFHPLIYKNLKKLKGLYADIIATKKYARWDDKEKDFVVADEIEGNTGFSFFVKHWRDIKFKRTGSEKRDDRIKLIEKYKADAMVDKILILPAGLRDIRMGSNNRLEFDEINDIYRRIISVSRVTTSTNESVNSTVLDYSRFQLQNGFNAAYDLFSEMLKGKGGFIQKKWAKRRVFNGTRNVISSMNTSKNVLGDPNEYRNSDTVVGLYQALKGALPLTISHLRNNILSDIFSMDMSSNTVNLVDKKTLKSSQVRVSPITKDKWTTTDGLEKVMNMMTDEYARHEPIDVEGYYLALIYKGPDKTFKVFNDIDQLPEGFDKSFVEPISLAELLYISTYQALKRIKVIVTRYPVAGLGSTYPSNVFVKTTNTLESRQELGDDWTSKGPEFIAPAFPVKSDRNFLQTMIPSIVRIAGLVADYDGDTTSGLFLYTDEAINEIDGILHSRNAYIDPSGGLRTSASTDTVNLVLRNLTGDLPTLE